ncbi:MAG: hypothetical protein COA69_00855 [Robiginitomaculum sp.]|nr:MAG: hypothetical protein COA69_00855 [Robiginitomaculum sp.]
MSISNFKNLKAILFITLCVFVMDRTAGVIGNMIVNKSNFRYAKLYTGRLDMDVAIFGNSRGVHSFYAPELSENLCRNVVNLSYNGLGIKVLEVIIRDVLEKTDGLDVAIIEVTSVLSGNNSERQLAPFTPYSKNLTNFLNAQSDSIIPWRKLFTSYRLNGELFYRVGFYIGRDDQSWINRGGGGYSR